MPLFKRILAGLVMGTSTIVAIVAVVAIIGAWAINTPVTTTLLNVLDAVDGGLVQIDTGVSNFNQRLDDTLQGLGELTAEIEQLGEDVAENSIILNAIEARWGEELAPAVDNLRQTAQGVRDTVAGIKATIEAVNSIPFVTVPAPEGENLQNVSDSVAELQENTQAFRREVADKRAEAADKLSERLKRPIERLSSGLQSLQTVLIEMDDGITQTLTEIRWLQEQVPVWIDWLSVIVTVIMLWLILSQVSLFTHAYHVLRPPATPELMA